MSEHFTQHRLSPETIPHDVRALSYARQMLGIHSPAKLAQAIEEAARAPRVASAWGLALLEHQRWDLLVGVCIRSLEYDQGHVGLMLLLSLGLSGIGESTEALIVLERVFELIEHEGHYYQLSVELAEAYQHRLERGNLSLTELPTFNMSTPDELVDLTDTSLSISMVREWLEIPGLDQSVGEPDLDGPTQNLTQGDLRRLLTEAGVEVVELEQDVQTQRVPQWPEHPPHKELRSLDRVEPVEEIESVSELESVLELESVSELGSVSERSSLDLSSWEMSMAEHELVSRSGDDPNTLSISDAQGLLNAEELTNVLEGSVMTSISSDEAMTSISSDEVMTSISSDEVMTSVASDEVMTSVASESVATRALDQSLLDAVNDRGRPQEDSVVTSAIPVVAPPRVPPPQIAPSGPPKVVIKPKTPSLKPSAQRSPPVFNPNPRTEVRPKSSQELSPPTPQVTPRPPSLPPTPPALPPREDPDSFNITPSTRALPDEREALKSKVSTRALPAERGSQESQVSTPLISKDSGSFKGKVSTRALPNESHSSNPAQSRSSRNFSAPSSLEPKPLERLREPEPLSPMERVSPPAPAHVGEMTTSMFEVTEDELSMSSVVASGERSPWVMLGTTLLILLSTFALLVGLGFQLQRRQLQEGLSLSVYASDDAGLRLSESLTLSIEQPMDWPLFVTQQISDRLGLSSETGRRLDGLRAWAGMLSWVGYGHDDRQAQAIEDLLIALEASPEDPFTLGALSLYLSALSAHVGAVEIGQMIPYQSWLRGLTLGVIHERAGGLKQAFLALQESDALNPSATLTQQLILSILDRYQSKDISLELQRRQARYGVEAVDLGWAAPSVSAIFEEGGPETLPSPVEQRWALSSLLRAQAHEKLKPLQQRLVSDSKLLESPSSRQLITALRYARMTLDQGLLSRAPQLIEERYLQGLITLTERNLAHFELALSKGDVNRAKQEQLAGSYEPHPKLEELIPELLSHYPNLKQDSFAQQVNQAHSRLTNLEVERLLLGRSWTSLRLLIRDQRAKQLLRATYARLETFTGSLTVEGVKSLSSALRAQGIKVGHDPHSSSYPDELLISYAMSESGQVERAARYALSFSRHDSLSSAAQLNANIFICRALDQVALLPSQWLSCKGAYERAPYRIDTSEGYAHLLEELGELEEVSELLIPLLKEEQSGALSPAFERLMTRVGLDQTSASNRSESNSSLERYRGAIQLLGDGLYLSGASALAQIPDSTRLERFERSALMARLTQDLGELKTLAAHGSLAAQLQTWALNLASEGKQPSQLALNAVIGSPQIARVTELVDLMSCFAREGRLDLHHMNLTRAVSVPLKASPPPAPCRASYHSLLKGSFKRSDLPPYAQHLAGLLYLSVGELANAEQLWTELLSDPIRSLEARLALGLLQLRQGRSGLVRDTWKPLIQERSQLSALLKQAIRR